jgi:hypothetical protein
MLEALGNAEGAARKMQEALLNAFYPFATLRAGSEAQRRRVLQRIQGAEILEYKNNPSENI